MAKVKYYAKENSTIGTHSFYAAIHQAENLRDRETHPLPLPAAGVE